MAFVTPQQNLKNTIILGPNYKSTAPTITVPQDVLIANQKRSAELAGQTEFETNKAVRAFSEKGAVLAGIATVAAAGPVVAPFVTTGTAAELATLAITGYLAPKVAEKAVEEFHPTYQTAKQDPLFQAAVQYGEAKAYEQTNKNFAGSMLNALPGGQIASTGTVGNYMAEYYRLQGVDSNSQRVRTAQKAMETRRNIGGIWEATGAVLPSAGAELLGTKTIAYFGGKTIAKQTAKVTVQDIEKQTLKILTTRSGKKMSYDAAYELAKRQLIGRKALSPMLKGLAVAGAYEGGSQEAMQSAYRNKTVLPDPVQTLAGASFGAASAAGLGGAIGYTGITAPGKSRVLRWLGYIADPYEKPGDVLGAMGKKMYKTPLKEFGVSIPGGKNKVPIFTLTSTPSVTVTQDEVKRAKAQGMTKQDLIRIKRLQLAFGVNIPSTTKGKNTFVPTFIPTNIPTNVPTNVPSDTNKPTNKPTDTPTFTPTETPTDTPTDVPTNVPTNVPTTVPTDVPTNVPVPVITPIARLFPPVPLGMSGSAPGGKGPVMRGGLWYYDEAAAARAAVIRLL